MPPKGRRRALSASSSTAVNDLASAVNDSPNIRRSKRRKVEPAEVQVKSEPRELKVKNKPIKRRPKGKKVKEEVIQEPDLLEDIKAGIPHSAEPPNDVVHVTEDLQNELESLRKQLREKDDQLQTQKEVLNTLHQQFNCQICFDTLLRPYALVPCGHIACLGCLQQWFKTNVGEEDGRDSPPPIILRKKTCPNCRTKVVQRPVAAFLIKEAISTLDAVLATGSDPATRLELGPAAGEDPWKDIFPVERDGAGRGVDGAFIDHDDGGVRRCQNCLYEIFHGTCVHCGEVYEMSDSDSHDSDDSTVAEMAGRLLHGHFPWRGMSVDISDDEDQDQYESDFINDEDEDGYRRHVHDSDHDLDRRIYRRVEQPAVVERIVEHIEITDADTDDDAYTPWVPRDPRRGWRGRAELIAASDDEDEEVEMRTDTNDVSETEFAGVNPNLYFISDDEPGEHYYHHMDHEPEHIFSNGDSDGDDDDDANIQFAQHYHHPDHDSDEDGESYDSDFY